MQAIKNAIWGNAQPEPQSDQEPITGDTGVGTSNEIPKNIESQSGQEPQSGYTGAGTATDPYDAGNKTG